MKKLSMFTTIQDAKKYLIDNLLPKFRDKSFNNYIKERLAGDFAWELANVLKQQEIVIRDLEDDVLELKDEISEM